MMDPQSGFKKPPTFRWRRVSWVVAATGKVYQWCRPAPVEGVNLCVTDIHDAGVMGLRRVKMRLGRRD